MTLGEKFKALQTNNAPGQEVRQNLGDIDSIMIGLLSISLMEM